MLWQLDVDAVTRQKNWIHSMYVCQKHMIISMYDYRLQILHAFFYFLLSAIYDEVINGDRIQ